MKDLTAEKVLKTTFKHLDTILDEKNRQLKKASNSSKTVAVPAQKKKKEKFLRS